MMQLLLLLCCCSGLRLALFSLEFKWNYLTALLLKNMERKLSISTAKDKRLSFILMAISLISFSVFPLFSKERNKKRLSNIINVKGYSIALHSACCSVHNSARKSLKIARALNYVIR